VQTIAPHELRHTCANLTVSSGANVLAVSRMLGHKDPSVTLRIYADPFDSDLDAVACLVSEGGLEPPRPLIGH
jgi:site-specific recombinase XerD